VLNPHQILKSIHSSLAKYFAIFVFTFSLTTTHAQSLADRVIPTSGDNPVFNTNYPIYVFSDSESYWLLNQNKAYSISINTWTWTKHPNISDTTDIFRGAYNENTGKFYLWSTGGGATLEWDPFTGSTKELGNQEPFKTQFGHSAVMDNTSSRLFLFGGYGHWEYRNTLNVFDFNTELWSVLQPSEENKELPGPRSDVMSAFDTVLNQIHYFGGYSTPSGRDDIPGESTYKNEYWIYDIQSNTWSQKPVTGAYFNFEERHIRPNLVNAQINWGAFDHKQNQAWFVHLANPGLGSYGLLVYDYAKDVALPLSNTITSGHKNAVLLYMDILEASNQLLTIWLPLKPVGEVAEVTIVVHDMPLQEAIKAEISDSLRFKWIPSSLEIHPRLVFILISAALIFGSFIFFSKKIKFKISSFKKTSSKNSFAQPKLVLLYHREPKLFINGLDITDNLSQSSLNMLLWYYWKTLIGEKYIITDEIERRFVEDSSNPDYSRKRRNSLIKRFNDDLSSLLSDYSSSTVTLVDRIHLDDKRKREYSFNCKNVVISSDIDTYFNKLGTHPSEPQASASFLTPESILASGNDEWIRDIRNSILAKTTE